MSVKTYTPLGNLEEDIDLLTAYGMTDQAAETSLSRVTHEVWGLSGLLAASDR